MATTTNFGWETPDDTDLVKDGAAAIRTALGGVDTSFVDLKGGTTGQILSKASDTDLDYSWVTTDDANAIQNAIVDAKGDLIAASASDVPARLAVGANGETLVADSSTSTGLRYTAGTVQSNPVLNSAMQVWQRGTSFSFAASTPYTSAFVADRWQTATGANQACTVSRQATGDTTNLPNIQYCLRYQRNSGQTGTGSLPLVQNFETINSIPFAGKTITFSFYARAGANYSHTGSQLAVDLLSGTGTDQNRLAGYTGNAGVISSSATLTTTWQRFTFTGTVGATATELAIYLQFTPTGTAGANDYYEITGLQIDIGSVALPFRTNAGTIQGELAACQRYYYRVSGGNPTYLATTAMGYSTTAILGFVNFPVTMRTTPTALDTSAMSTFAWDRGNTGSGNTPSSITADTTWNASIGAYQVNTTGITANSMYRVYANAANAYVGFTAEL